MGKSKEEFQMEAFSFFTNEYSRRMNELEIKYGDVMYPLQSIYIHNEYNEACL
jgi:hypothetical protein